MSGGDLQAWVGREQRVRARIDPWPAAALTAALGRDDPPGVGEALPPFWHLLYGHLPVGAAQTGADGHPERGGFTPPVPGRRMWAGGRLRLHRQLRVGEEVEKVSTVRAVTPKAGRHGPLVFVLVEHRVSVAGEVVLVEEQDIVYRDGEAGPSRAVQTEVGRWRRAWRPDPVLLFRYSALTWNGHRIHYDEPYAREAEGYPGLVVHGPLLATLMLDLVRRERPGAKVRAFSFRAVSPLFAGSPLTVHGEPEGALVRLRVAGEDGRLAMQGQAELED